MALKGYTNPQDPLPRLSKKSINDGSGDYCGAYAARKMGSPSSYNTSVNQKLIRSDGADPFVRTASKGSFESSGVVGSVDAPDVGGIDAVNFKGR